MGFAEVVLFILYPLCGLILVILSLVFWDKRNQKNHGLDVPAGFEKTDEITIDPTNGKKYRVYFNSSNGERFYHEE